MGRSFATAQAPQNPAPIPFVASRRNVSWVPCGCPDQAGPFPTTFSPNQRIVGVSRMFLRRWRAGPWRYAQLRQLTRRHCQIDFYGGEGSTRRNR